MPSSGNLTRCSFDLCNICLEPIYLDSEAHLLYSAGFVDNLDDDWAKLRRNNLDRFGASKELLPLTNLSRHTHYRDYFTDEMRALVESRFYADLTYGYSYEDDK